MEKQKIILDCDPGHDDAVAMMVAFAEEGIDLLGITTVNGNAPLEAVLQNALNVCQHLELDVPVYRGMDRPMVRERFNAPAVHGKNGLEGPVFPPCTKEEEPVHAVQFIIDTLRNSDGDIVLVPTGPLTNVAMAMRLAPDIVKKIKRISLMGGSAGPGNMSPAAEFNILADPEAAHVVFTSGVPITMMGLDVTNTALATMDIIERMEAIGNKAGALFGEMLRFTFNSQRHVGLPAGPVHDVLAVTWLVHPEFFTVDDMHVDVDLSKGPSYGRTNCDINHVTGVAPNATVGLALDLPAFWDYVESQLKKLA